MLSDKLKFKIIVALPINCCLIFLSGLFCLPVGPVKASITGAVKAGITLATKTSLTVDSGNNKKDVFPKPTHFHLKTIVIDAGHGGYDPGASGVYAREKIVTLSIARHLREVIHKQYPGIHIIMTRSTDEFIPLDRRAAIAVENKASLFISIHCNASSDTHVSGAETYAIGLNSTKENLQVAERENSVILLENNYKQRYAGFDPRKAESYIIFSMVQSHMISRSLKLATKIQEGMGASHGRGVKQAGFLVLRKTTMPSVLVETGFITNPRQEKLLSSKEGQILIANRIFKGFEKYKHAIE